MKRLIVAVAATVLAGEVWAETITVKAGETLKWPADRKLTGEVLVKEGPGTLDLSGVAMDNAGLDIRDGAVYFTATGDRAVTARYFRFTVQASRPGKPEAPIHGGSGSQISEFRLLKDGKVIPYPEGTTATSPSPGDQSAEGAPKAIDNDTHTKWYGGYRSPLTIDLTRPVTFDAYTFVTANDAIGRDPHTWTVEAGFEKRGKISWAGLGGETGYLAPEARFTEAGKLFKVGMRDAFPFDYPITVGPKGKLILENLNETTDALAGSGVIELRHATLSITEPATFSGTAFGSGSVTYP